ncbi:MAG: hypothetical protein PVSMB5_21980 [Ktedonobacteraceae bacterium]
MKPETERLLQQCRATLLQYSAEQLNTLLVAWFEQLIGEEQMDEDLDDLCLLLGYRIRARRSQLLYATYTSWWEVEGYINADGEFECIDVTTLQHRLITMSLKQFALVSELAYQVCVQDTEAEGLPRPPIGQDWLRALAAWLASGAREPFHSQRWGKGPLTTPVDAQTQLTHKQRRAQQRKIENELVEQAWRSGYLLMSPDISNQVPALVQNRCKKNRRPYINVRPVGTQLVSIYIELNTVRKAFEAEGKLFSGAPEPIFTPTDALRERLRIFAEKYSATAETPPQDAFTLSQRGDIFELRQVAQADVPNAVQDFMALWPEIITHYELQLEAARVAYAARQRELEEERKPAWLKAIACLSAQGADGACPELAETVILPADWPALLSKEQLGAFLTFLKIPASSREIKANLVQHLTTCMETNKNVKALLFEVFAFELAVPPWELETLLNCTTGERKRWTEEGKLPILGHSSFRKAGSSHEYAVYDRRIILTLTNNDIEQWRAEHQARVRERRRTAAQAAAASRKAKQKEVQTANSPSP